MNQQNKPIVTITGISGYLGSQTCLAFLKDGGFKVRGTVRSKTNTSKIQPLRQAFGKHFEELELVEANLLDDWSIMQAIQGSDYVVHTASPFPFKMPKDEQQIIRPAVNGTLAVMKACLASKVKRVVITSSLAAVYPDKGFNKSHYTEEDWADLDSVEAYPKSKILAEKVAWEFVKNLPENTKLEVVAINPGLIIGPNLNKAAFSSGDIVKKFMMREVPGVLAVTLPFVDVRDVALAHLQAIKIPEAANRRFIVVEKSYWMRELVEVLRARFLKDGYNVPTFDKFPYFVMWLRNQFVGDSTLALQQWGKMLTFDNKTTKQILQMDFIPMKQSAVDMGEAMIRTGYIPDKRGGKAAMAKL